MPIPIPVPTPVPIAILPIRWLLLACSLPLLVGWETALASNSFGQDLGENPCADSAFADDAFETWGERWSGFAADCDPDETALFSDDANVDVNADAEGRMDPASERNHASFSWSRDASGNARRTLRQRGTSQGWSDRVEVRNDTLTRRQVGWSRTFADGSGLQASLGDLEASGSSDDPDLSLWSNLLPRRRLPRGWERDARRGAAGYGLSSPMPQGVAGGVFGTRWRAWATRGWNPILTGDEPPWSSAWNLRHASTGISLALPWIVTARYLDTRISRASDRGEEEDSLAEQMLSAEVASRDGAYSVLGAVSHALEERSGNGLGWALATSGRQRFADSYVAAWTVRQRSADWASAWDAGVTDATGQAALGAGEYRLKVSRPKSWSLETWRAWNPAAGTTRTGTRAGALWTGEARDQSIETEAEGTLRGAHRASGSSTWTGSIQVETRLQESPAPRARIERAWNREGPTQTALLIGMDPQWNSLHASTALRFETDANDRLQTYGSARLRWTFSKSGAGPRWSLDAGWSAQLHQNGSASETRWRLTVER